MKFTKRQKVLVSVGLLILIIISVVKIYYRQENIRVALEFGRLAKLPRDSKNVRVETAGGFFSRTFWLTFEASSDEIDEWIRNSGELKRIEWENGNGLSNAIIKVLDEKTGEWRELKRGPIRETGQPDWFNPEKLLDGELYEVSMEKEALYGKVWVDRKNNRVFIQTSYS